MILNEEVMSNLEKDYEDYIKATGGRFLNEKEKIEVRDKFYEVLSRCKENGGSVHLAMLYGIVAVNYHIGQIITTMNYNMGTSRLYD